MNVQKHNGHKGSKMNGINMCHMISQSAILIPLWTDGARHHHQSNAKEYLETCLSWQTSQAMTHSDPCLDMNNPYNTPQWEPDIPGRTENGNNPVGLRWPTFDVKYRFVSPWLIFNLLEWHIIFYCMLLCVKWYLGPTSSCYYSAPRTGVGGGWLQNGNRNFTGRRWVPLLEALMTADVPWVRSTHGTLAAVSTIRLHETLYSPYSL